MKLIDLLVQELPKHGGWPSSTNDVLNLREFMKKHSLSFTANPGNQWFTDGSFQEVTLEQYESAFSALQQPEWNGEGLPPVGTECEYMVRQAANQFWQICTVIASGKENLIADVNGEEVVFFAPQIDFRPRRNEAERKREEVGVALFYAINWNHQDGPVSEARMEDYRKAYDAIAAGKIPHITLK
ncbi:hypothetical protein LZU96_15240 [Pantoea agglomerans]|uniref:hypothetical protein n=1 Tax=Enterobacter agglomerans TaxID=549 RepID=UPI001F2D0A0E|nr:hypothetical protein [Pantoea agglomerans]UIL51572.1 hypothetical protein LZU96_15240 [Pantoea agglomerans]